MKVDEVSQRVDAITDGITDQHGGYLRCETCRATGPVRAGYWRAGWPKCCGYTMRWWPQRQINAGEVPA